ncbi:hypothetical protein PIB30_098253 [Stylosanthes scabra]|uniref:Uncharacterized protein n=1 Tax=Stylosanthes scabra TaxID=79078 RepID=A0ABU6QWK2_9FABA|nr:hypothetical protein [Stylosanthes scabra]
MVKSFPIQKQFQQMLVTNDASMRQMFQIYGNTQAQILLIELYIEIEEAPAYVGGYNSDEGGHREITWYEDNSDNQDDFEASCKINEENENVRGEEEANTARQINGCDCKATT